jgi:aryl-alcohol dehydrogenase-like predicted oxidoreductase
VTIAARPLGDSGLATPRLILGGNVFGWTVRGEEAFRILDCFVDGGGVMIDTAEAYSSWVPGNRGGESEALIGEWLRRRGRRDEVLIATKCCFDGNLTPAGIAAAAEGSLRRLGVEAIDLYYSHRDDPQTPLAESLAGFDALIRAGKVRAIGASQIEAERLAEALDTSEREGLPRYSVLQTWYNLVEREKYEGPLADLVGERGLGMAAFYGLANGFLTGKYRTRADAGKSVRGERVIAHLDGKGPRVLAALDDVAAEAGATMAQVALAWLAAQPTVTAPIASATSVEQVEELVGAMTLELSADQLARLAAASD